MDCTDTRSRLDTYLDQELDSLSAMAIDQHLSACTACQQVFAAQFALQSGIRHHATYHRAPDELLARVRARIGSADQPPAPRRWSMPQWITQLDPIVTAPAVPQWLRFGAALTATAVLSWMAATEFARPSAEDLILDEVIAGHARSLVTNHVSDVASSDQHTVKPWLSSRLDFSPPVADFTQLGYPLIGGRLDYIGNKNAAALVFRHREHLIDVFVWRQDGTNHTAPVLDHSKRGYNVVHWNDGGLAFWAVSDLNPAEMKSFVDVYASAR